ncbi:MAG: hypothetical protein JXR05_04980 [Flavobacteriaceae bacterium]
MIYDYSTNPPNLVTANQADTLFPGFYFADKDLFFIYPSDDIIYNYTLGAFFKYIRDSEYKQITLPAVSLKNMGDLIGYTQANPNQLPTLYYTNGRLTLQHGNCRNIGWHPRKGGYSYVYGNILHPNNPKVFTLGSQFDQAAFDEAVNEAKGNTSNDVRLIELYYNDDLKIVSRHVSRSRLISGYPPNFVLNPVNQFLAAKEISPPPF